MESQPQNPEFRNDPENFHPCITSTGQVFFVVDDHLVNIPAKLYSVLTIGIRDVKSSYGGILGNPGKEICFSYFVSRPVTISVKLFNSDNSLQEMFKVSSLWETRHAPWIKFVLAFFGGRSPNHHFYQTILFCR